MISAPNLRQRLSGNKFLLLAFSVVLLSCNAFQLVPKKKIVEVEDTYDDEIPLPNMPHKVEPKPEKVTPVEEEALETVDFFGETYQVASHKKDFRIALILPFFYNAETEIERRTSEIMLDYYTGVKVALTTLEARGMKLKLYVYDNKNDTNELKRILSRWEFKSMDLIVGPIKENHLQIVSDYALKHNSGVFSPFSSVNHIVPSNKLFYTTSPNTHTKAKKIVAYIEKKYKNKKLIIVRDGQGYEKEFVPILIEELKRNGKIRFSEVTYSKYVAWSSQLTSSDTTLVYVPSNQSFVVNSTMGAIIGCKREVLVFGEGSWAEFEDNDYNFWTRLNVHLFATDYIDYSNEEVANFRATYRELYKKDPNLYAYLGNDQFRFMGDFLMAFGELYPGFICNKSFRYLSSSFNFNFSNGYNQNTNLFILGFRDMKLVNIE